MEKNFSPKVKEVISNSREEALRLGHDHIGIEHLLLGLIRQQESDAIRVLESLDVDIYKLRLAIEDAVKEKVSHPNYTPGNIPLTKQAEKVLRITMLEAKLLNSQEIDTEHLMLSILKNKENIAAQILRQFEIDYELFKTELEFMRGEISADSGRDRGDDDESFEEDRPNRPSSKGSKGNSKSKTPVLDNFGRDITKLADEGRLDPIVGRETEIERVSQILSRRKKNNPILIGEPGVGKTAIVEGLALRINQRKVRL